MTDKGHGKNITFADKKLEDIFVTAGIPLGESGEGELRGFTKTSFVGALNELKSGVAGDIIHDVFTVTAGKTSFTLSEEPADPQSLWLAWQGQLSTYGAAKDFTVSGTTLTWKDPEGPLEADASFQAWYWTHPVALTHVKHEVLTVNFDGETSFPLASTPGTPTAAMLSLNGQLSTYGASNDFTISGNTLIWKDPGALTLKTTSHFQIWFW